MASFTGYGSKSVDPFGTAFEVYIDAPMLELGNMSAALAAKIRKDPNKEGRFIYTVDADRDIERAYGASPALVSDQTGADQSGERKVIPFRVKDIVSAGEISISSQEETVVFNRKRFKVQNKSIIGRLKYRNGSLNDVPFESFVVLERIKTYNRIGTVTIGNVGADGHNMDIRLRGEYNYSWYNDPVKIQYARTSGGDTIVYEKTFESLDELYNLAEREDIILEKVESMIWN